MKSPDGTTVPSWYTDIEIPQHGSLTASAEADVCVVGAGIAGLTTAYLLAGEGKSVIVLDEGPIGGGQTGRTSAHLASAIDDRFVEIEKLHGKEGARLAYESHAAAIDTIERNIRKERIECSFSRVDAFLSTILSDSPDFLDREFEAAKQAGFADIELVDQAGLDHNRCIRFGRQARFQPLLYVTELAQAFTRRGGRIFTGQRVTDVQGADTKKNERAYAQLANDIRVTADHIVVATNTPSPINEWFGIYTKQASYRTYVIGAEVPRGSVPDALYWDTADPYHYVRLQQDHSLATDLLLIGGEDHKTGQLPAEGDPFERLEVWAREKFPMIQKVSCRWSGQVQEPADGLAFIGRAPTSRENVFVATGDSGMGLTHGTIAGLLITDLIMGRTNPWEKLYDPSRKMLNLEYLSENANTVAQYKDLITGGEVKDVDEIAAGEGAVMREGVKKVAVYRDPTGQMHRCSAFCTHMQCVVQWNRLEKSWDCPCHGSRFDPVGKVLIGPAIEDLSKL